MKTCCILQPHLYVSENLRNAAYTKWRLKRGGFPNVYLITEAPGMPGQLAMLHARMLQQAYYAEHPLRVYGIAKNKEDARQLLLRISDDAIAAGKAGELMKYLDGRG
ncbi:MAG: hypothetical protein IJR00_09090 [Lachnospiraceae bacterium]|nr:hypothetical protein [Lachnospiraceae bacterium]